jgi:predicted Zn-dependent protease
VPKKSKHHKKAKNSNADVYAQAEPGLRPLVCGKDKNGGFDPHRVVGVGSHMIKIKPGSIEDVSSIGTRHLFGRGIGNWYSLQDQIRMGASYAQQIDKTARFIKDPVVDEYINRIVQNIRNNSDCKVPFSSKVIDTSQINAFSLPGGFVYVNSGLILAADNEAELAAVLGHETAHVCAQHAARELTRMHLAQVAMLPMMFVLPYSWTGMGIYEGSQLAIPMAFLEFSRQFEAQADYLGVQYLYKAGYDPQAMIDFFEKIEALQKRKPGLVAKIFDNHPETPDRILHTQEEIAEILPPRPEYLVNTSKFEAVKARLARIENHDRLTNHNRNQNKPSLRRASNSNGASTPTLHRRNDN